MNGFSRFVAAFVVFALVPLTLATGVAQQRAQGVVNAVSFAPAPDGLPLWVRTLDNAATDTMLKAELEEALRFNGHPTTRDDTPLVLTLDASKTIGSWDNRSGALIEADRGYDENLRKDTDRFVLNIFNSRQGGLVNRGEPPGQVKRTSYRLDATLADTRSGRTIWHGWTVAELADGDREALMKSMVPALIEAFDQSVRQQPFVLR